jgi:hypothetical protein
MKIHGAKPRSDPETILRRLAELNAAFEEAYTALHKFDGTQLDSPFGNPEMRVAGEYLETALLWARHAVETS